MIVSSSKELNSSLQQFKVEIVERIKITSERDF
jgi:hypothetical protein